MLSYSASLNHVTHLPFLILKSFIFLIFHYLSLARLCFGPRVFIYLLVCMYACYQLFSKTTGPNWMKFSGMICHHPRTNPLDFGSDWVKDHERVKNYWTKLHEIFRDYISSSKDQLIRFWERSGQRSRPRS